MSEDDEQSWFYRNRKKFWAFTAFIILFSLIGAVDTVYNIGILSIVFHPVLLAFYLLSIIVVGVVYAFRNYKSGSMPDFSSEEEGIKELSTFECEELAKEYLFREDEPVLPNGYDRKKTIPVTDEQTHEAEVEVFEYVFTDKFSGARMSIQFPVSQDIELDKEWFDDRTPENERNLRDAIRGMENVVVENLTYADQDQKELLKNNRQELGEAIVREKRVVQYDQRGQPVSEQIGVAGTAPDPDQDFSRLVGDQGVKQNKLEDQNQQEENNDSEEAEG